MQVEFQMQMFHKSSLHALNMSCRLWILETSNECRVFQESITIHQMCVPFGSGSLAV